MYDENSLVALVFLSLLFGLAIGFGLGYAVTYSDGTKTEITECLKEQPNVCRTVTTFTDVYKKKN